MAWMLARYRAMPFRAHRLTNPRKGNPSMSREDILTVALRLFAIYLVIGALQLVGQASATDINLPTGSLIVAIILSIIFPLLIAALLWLLPLRIAAILLPGINQQHTALSTGTVPALEIGCILIGLWLLASSLSDSTYWVITLIAALNNEWGLQIIPMQDLASMAATLMQLGLSAWLLLGYRGILKFVRRLRSREVSQP
jgi:hypothetical protein